MSTDVETQTRGRVPPQDLGAERCVLGGMMLSPDAIDAVADILTADHFYRPAHTTVYRTITRLYAAGEPVDAITVAAALADSGDLARVGGVPYLHDMISATPSAANAGYYARIVAERASMRAVIEAGMRITELGYGTGREPADVVDLAQQATYALTDQRSRTDWRTIGDLFQPTIDEIEAIGATAGTMRGVPTGFRDLDRLLNGLQGGQLIVVAGRPGLGKSTLALDIVRHASIVCRVPSAYFSLEMSSVELIMRVLSAQARVPLHAIRSGQLSDADWIKIAGAMGAMDDPPLMVDESASTTLMEIRAKARRMKERHNLGLIVVDYLQLMGAADTGRRQDTNRQEIVADISRGLKLLGKELNVPVIAVSQLNRGPEQRADKRPQLSDIRESGSIEQDADVVILLHRDDYYDKSSPRAGECDLIVAKHRNGPTDTITVAAQLHLSRFVDMSII